MAGASHGARLGVEDWLRLDWGEELDIVGPYARLALRRHGILAPFNSHFHLPLIQLARGGSMLTGIGGDELLSPVSREVAAAILMRRRLPGRGELPALALALAPRPLRTAVIARRRRVFRTFGWLTSTARRRVALAYASWESRDPLRWDVALRSWWWRSRTLQCNRAGKAALRPPRERADAPSAVRAGSAGGDGAGMGPRWPGGPAGGAWRTRRRVASRPRCARRQGLVRPRLLGRSLPPPGARLERRGNGFRPW